jgi:hypothetical protein
LGRVSDNYEGGEQEDIKGRVVEGYRMIMKGERAG